MSKKNKVEKKRDELLKLNREVFSRLKWENIDKRKLILNLILTAIIVLIIIFWNSLTDFLASVLRQSSSAIASQSQAQVIANYLLFALIIATIGVETFPIIRDWWNRPILRLHSFSYATNELRVRVGGSMGLETPQPIHVVYLNLYNDGRGEAKEPIVDAEAFPSKLSKFLSYDVSFSSIDSTLTVISANFYDSIDHDQLAVEFMKKGTKKVEYVEGHHQGKRLLLGFAFKGGTHFYFASQEGAELAKIKFQEEQGYATFLVHARNAKKKMLKMNVPMNLSAWDNIHFDYREWAIRKLGEEA